MPNREPAAAVGAGLTVALLCTRRAAVACKNGNRVEPPEGRLCNLHLQVFFNCHSPKIKRGVEAGRTDRLDPRQRADVQSGFLPSPVWFGMVAPDGMKFRVVSSFFDRIKL